MHYAVGHAFNLTDIFLNFKSSKLKIDCVSLNYLYGDTHKKNISKKIFKECCKIIIKDIIENDVEFLLPTGAKKTSLMVKDISETDFKHARQNGKYLDIDFLVTMFKGFDLLLYMYGKRNIAKSKSVYLNKELKLLLIDNINNGKVYYGKIIKTTKDYVDDVNKLFPRVPKSDILKILNFGWRSLYLHNSYGGDTLISDNSFWFYIGSLYKNSFNYFNYYAKKLSIKLRILHKRNNIGWDGYYYFPITENEYEELVKAKNKRGRPRKYFNFTNVFAYKLFDECSIKEHGRKYIARTRALIDLGYSFYSLKYSPSNVELFLVREPLKFKDILTSNHDYEIL